MSVPLASVTSEAHGRHLNAKVNMSESERMPGYLNRSHVPPRSSRASRTATDLVGWSRSTLEAASMPDRPAPMMRTSTCSLAMAVRLLASTWVRSPIYLTLDTSHDP